MEKQVEKSHYLFSNYMTSKRWSSIWHQLNETISFGPETVLEIGPGPGIFKSAAAAFGIQVKTLDLDPELAPDYTAPATQIPLPDLSVDVVCAFQVLEHMPFEESIAALKQMCRIAKKAVVISLPDARTCWPMTINAPRLGQIRILLQKPFFLAQQHQFNGQHYWEVNKKGHELEKTAKAISEAAPGFSIRTFRAHENPYHRFFVLART